MLVKVGGASCFLIFFKNPDELYLSSLISNEEGKGHATKVLELCKLASELTGVPLVLDVSSGGFRSQEELIKFYRKRGFRLLSALTSISSYSRNGYRVSAKMAYCHRKDNLLTAGL